MRRLKTLRRPPIYPKSPGHLPCSSLTHPIPLPSPRPSVSFGGFGLSATFASRSISVMSSTLRRFHAIDNPPFLGPGLLCYLDHLLEGRSSERIPSDVPHRALQSPMCQNSCATVIFPLVPWIHRTLAMGRLRASLLVRWWDWVTVASA